MLYYSANISIIELSKENCTHYYTKRCTGCGIIKPATINFFHKEKSSKYGLNAKCKICKSNKYKAYYNNTAEKQKERALIYHYKNKDKCNNRCLDYYYKNIDQCKERHKEWLKNNPEKVMNYENNRRSKLEEGQGLTKEQWVEMMTFFDWKCAYSGIDLTESNRSVDHILALSNGGENEIWNLVPMIKNYNSSKHTHDMETWYKQQDYYLEERLQKIIEWQLYAYNKWSYLQPGSRGNTMNSGPK